MTRSKIILIHIVVVLAAATVVYLLCAGLAQSAEPTDCSLTYTLKVGAPEKCPEHVSVPSGYLAGLLRTETELEATKKELAHEHGLRLAHEERDAAIIAALEQSLAACEASRIPPKCEEPGTWSRPSVAWPVGLGAGFVAGFATSQWGVRCR